MSYVAKQLQTVDDQILLYWCGNGDCSSNEKEAKKFDTARECREETDEEGYTNFEVIEVEG